MRSFTFMATQSMPMVSYLSIIWAISAFVPTPSVEMASPMPPISRTLAKYPMSSLTDPLPSPKDHVCRTLLTRRWRPASSRAVSTPAVRYATRCSGGVGSIAVRSLLYGPKFLAYLQNGPETYYSRFCLMADMKKMAGGSAALFLVLDTHRRPEYGRHARGILPAQRAPKYVPARGR